MWSSLFLFLKKGDLQDEATGEKEYTMLWKTKIRNTEFAQFLNSTQTAISVVPLLVLCWYHRTIK